MQASPYPLGGDPRDVIEDVRRLGGFGIVAHPDSPKDDLRWREWNEPFDGIELVNLDTGWRTRVEEHGWRSMVTALATYPFRPTETIGHLAGESTVAFARWESLTRRRRIVALGGADAHAKLALADVEPGDNRFSLPIPGYEAALGSLTLHVRLERALSGDAEADAKLVLAGIRSGHLYTALNAIAAPAYLDVTATNERGSAQAGDELPAAGPVALRIRTNAPPGFKAAVWRGQELLSGDHGEQDFTVAAPPDPAVYRVEVRAADRSRSPLWLLSNPIYVRGATATTVPPARPPATDARRLFDERDAAGWSTETDPTSLAAFDVRRGTTVPEIGFRFGLATGDTTHQFAAIGVVTPDGVQPLRSADVRGPRRNGDAHFGPGPCARQPGLPGALGAIGVSRAHGPSDFDLFRRHDADWRHPDLQAIGRGGPEHRVRRRPDEHRGRNVRTDLVQERAPGAVIRLRSSR